MNLGVILKFIHVLAAFWLTSGIIGQTVTVLMAKRSTDIRAMSSLLSLSMFFQRSMVSPGSGAVVIAGLVTAWAEGWPILGFIQGGTTSWVLAALLLFITLIPVIALIFMPRGRVLGAAMQQAAAQGHVTPELTAALNDPVVRAGTIYQYIVLVLIIALMVLKPF